MNQRLSVNNEWLRAIGYFIIALAASSLPYLLLRIVYPSTLLDEGSSDYFNTSKYLVSDRIFVGVSLVLAVFIFWTESYARRNIKATRKFWSTLFASLAVFACLGSVAIFALLHHMIDVEPEHLKILKSLDEQELGRFLVANAQDLLEVKYIAFWLLYIVICLTFLSIFTLHSFLERESDA